MNLGRIVVLLGLTSTFTRAQTQATPDQSAPTASPAPVSKPTPPSPWPLLETLSIFKEGRPEAPLEALEHLRGSRERALGDATFGGMYFEVLATVRSFVGDYPGALEAEREYFARSEHRVKTPADLAGYHAEPAVAAIGAASEGRRVVMLNEEHRVSLQRAFLAEVIPELRRRGFTHLAMETLSEEGAAVEARGYAVAGSGMYLKDPCLAEAVRLAIGLGMHIVKYEADPKDIGPQSGDRDRLAAMNLARVLREDPAARVVVYAGRYHIARRGDATWTPLAARLHESAGVDPLCVDLIAMRECHRPEDEYPAYRSAVEAKLVTDAPVVLVDGSGRRFSHWPEEIDLSVFFPRTIDHDGRPGWLARGQWRWVPIADRLARSEETLLVRADRPGEDATAVPADQFIVLQGRAAPGVLLPPGRFRVRALTVAGRTISEFDIDVAP